MGQRLLPSLCVRGEGIPSGLLGFRSSCPAPTMLPVLLQAPGQRLGAGEEVSTLGRVLTCLRAPGPCLPLGSALSPLDRLSVGVS